MATSFSRTLRSLEADRSRRYALLIVVALVVLAAWGTWMVRARLAVYETTRAARIEVEQAAHPVQAPVAGRIVAVHLELGRVVQEGDVLCEFDVQQQALDLAQAKAHLAAIEPELAAVRAEIAATTQAGLDRGQGAAATVAEAQARLDEADAALKLAEGEVDRATKMRAEGVVSEADLQRAKSAADVKRAAVDAARSAVTRVSATGRADVSERRVQKEALQRDVAILDGDKLTTEAQIARLENEISRRVLRASVSGKLAEIAPITVGSVVKEGDVLGAIVPSGDLRIVAEFPPARALGRIAIGQTARMRLDGFPWAQHGMLPARVTNIASEVRGGLVRVELEVLPNQLDVPLQHGLPGSLEVEVERTSPITLLLRAVGKSVDGTEQPTASPTASTPP